MSNAVIGALRVNLGLDSAQFEKGAKRSQNTLGNMRKQFLVVAGAAAAMGAALSAAALKGAKEIDEAAKASRRLGTSIGGFRAAQLAAGELGVSVSALTDNLQTMNREIERGSAGAKRSLDALGISAAQLSGLDADQKLALIADQVQSLGLNADQASVLLQDLGIRNREMVLAVLSGGGAFRKARSDIEDYGLAINSVDAANIEKANDAIGRLGLISQYAGQQLAIALVPAMGRLAEAMTDSLREGGALRAVIDGLVNNLDILSATVAAAVTVMGVRYVGALALARGATLNFAGALAVARGAIAALLGPVGLLYIAIGTGAAAWIAHRQANEDATGAMNSAESAAANLSIELTQMAKSDLPNASKATVQLANDNLTLARSAFAAAQAQVELAKASLAAADAQLGNEAFSGIESGLLPGQKARADALAGLLASQRALASAEADLNARVLEGNTIKSEAAEVVERLRGEVAELESEVSGRGGSRGATPALKEMDKTADNLADTLSGPLTSAIDGVANAFADFMMRGLRDFKSFARGILDSFKRMLAEMIATAAKNKIIIPIMTGGSIAASTAQAASTATGMGAIAGAGGLAGLGSAFLGGGSFVASGFMSGGLAGAGSAMATAMSGATMGIGGFAAALGAVALPLAAVTAAVMFFRTTTKTLDSGLRVTVGNMNALVETFKKTEKSRFFGLSTSRSTSFREVANSPLAAAVNEMQTSILDAARVLGVGGAAFEDFSYQFRVSLRGLSQEQQIEKINAELAKMGDSFARLAPGIENMNELLQQAAQISANVRAFTDTSGLFATRQDAVFAASQAGNQRTIGKTPSELLVEILRAIREGDINQARLSSQLVALQQREALAPT